MSKYLDIDDINLLRSNGFVAGSTGHAWYGKDVLGDKWRVAVAQNNDLLMFATMINGRSGEFLPMRREDFDEQFTN